MEGKKKVFSCILVCLSAFTQGTMFLWNSFSLPDLANEALMGKSCNISDSNLTTDATEDNCVVDISGHGESLIASAHSIGAALGAVLCGSLLSFGHLHIILPILSIAVVLSWAMMIHAPSLTIMVVAKTLLGLFLTLQCSQVPLYIAQVAPTQHRGLLLSSFSIIRNLSQIIVTASAELLNPTWRMMTYLFGIVPAALLALAGPCLSKVEEKNSSMNNPSAIAYGLMNVTNFSALMNSTLTNQNPVKCGRGMTIVPNSLNNIAQLDKLSEKKNELERNYGSAKVSTNSHKNWSIIRSTLFLMFFASSYILSGMVLITSFPSKLFTATYPFNPLLAMSVSLFSNFIGSIASSFLTDKFGIGIILMMSSSVMALCMSCLSVYYSFDMCSTNSFMCYFPLIIIITFFISLSIGIGTIFMVIIGEKLPLKKRSLTMPMIMVTMEILEAVQNFILPLLITYLDTHGLTFVFGGHALANVASVLVAFLWLE